MAEPLFRPRFTRQILRMQRVRVILDFPPDGRNGGRLRFDAPRRVLSVDRAAGVRPVLREAEQAAHEGAWVVGMIAYEAAPAFDPAFMTRNATGPAPLAWFAVFDAPATEEPAADSASAALPGPWTPDMGRAEYDDAIRRIRSAIADGAVYQVNHTLRFDAPCTADPVALYDTLVAAGHGAYHALIATPDWAVVSASPELFFDLNGRTVITRPMKGTRRRGDSPEEDAAAAAVLAASEKDRAENLMIVDLLRNDLGRIARFGTVAVPEMFTIETYPTVHQMTSTITAELRDDVGIDDIFAAMFPCGSVTGAPKIAAMQQIAALERTARGPYCGAIGVIRPDGTATFNVAIRTLLLDPRARTATYGAGGGITWDSRADAEYDEAVAKTALLVADVDAFDLLETMRLDEGTIPRLDRHLDRLESSARALGFPTASRAAAAAALDALRAAVPTGAWRVRLALAHDARVHIARTPLDEPAGTRDAGSAHDARTFAIERNAVRSTDTMLAHKTTARARYDSVRARHPDAFDVLLVNEHDDITEFTTGNIVCELDGVLVTPPQSAGLLAGTFRAELLDARIIREADIALDDVSRAARVWLINSVREWVLLRAQTKKSERAESANGLCPPR